MGGVSLVTCRDSKDSHATPVTWEEAKRRQNEEGPEDAGPPASAENTDDAEHEVLFEVHDAHSR